MANEGAASWRTIRYGSPVLAADGSVLGTVAEVLGSDALDLFHGIRMRKPGTRSDLVVPANAVTEITRDRVATDLTAADLARLSAYDEEATYHLASVGWLRRHLAWKRDADSDEEPG